MWGQEYLKGHSGAKNMSEKNSERVESPSSFSRSPSIPSIMIFSETFGSFYPISERVNNSTQNITGKFVPVFSQHAPSRLKKNM